MKRHLRPLAVHAAIVAVATGLGLLGLWIELARQGIAAADYLR